MKFYDIEQGSIEWLALRLGKFTSSNFGKLFMGKSTDGYKKNIYKAVFERLTNERPESFRNEWMDRGNELEPEALKSYEMLTFNKVRNGGFFEFDEWTGASPDGLIGKDGLVQVKCLKYNTMIEYLQGKNLPKDYHYQCHGEMMATGRKWNDFYAYHPKLKPVIIRIERDEAVINEIQIELEIAIKKAKEIMTIIK